VRTTYPFTGPWYRSGSGKRTRKPFREHDRHAGHTSLDRDADFDSDAHTNRGADNLDDYGDTRRANRYPAVTHATRLHGRL